MLAQAPEAPRPLLPLVQHYGVEEGLSNRFVRDVFQDRQGFIWLSTNYGLNRFDGHRFTTYTAESQGFGSNYIAAVGQDPDGWLWVFQREGTTLQHLHLLDPRTGRVESFREHFGWDLPFPLSEIDPASIRGHSDAQPWFFLTNDGGVWHYTGRGRLRRVWRENLPRTTRRTLRQSPNRTTYVEFSDDPSTHLLQFSAQGTLLSRRIVPYPLRYIADDSAGRAVFVEADARRENQRLTGGADLRSAQVTAAVPIPNGRGNDPAPTFGRSQFSNFNWLDASILPDSARQRAWQVSAGGVWLYRPGGGVLHDFTPQLAGFVGSLDLPLPLLDRSGSLWVTTDNGVLVLDAEPTRFRTLLHAPPDAPSRWLSTRAIHPLGDSLWVASMAGLHRVHARTGQGEKVSLPQADGRDAAAIFQYALYADRRGQLWFGTDQLVRFDPRTGASRVFPLRPEPGRSWAMAEDSAQTLWIGAERGLSRFDLRRERERPFAGYGTFPELASAKITFLRPDGRGGLWVGASTGLYQLDPQAGRITARYHRGGDKTHRLPFDFVTDLYADRHIPNRYWLATRGSGLLRWDPISGQTRVFSRAEGLSNEIIHAVYDDDHDGLWLPSDNGLMRFDKETGNVRAFFRKDGLSHDEFNLNSHGRAPDGHLYFGGLNGITAFQPRDFYERADTRPTRLSVAGFQRQDARMGLFTDQTAEFWPNAAIRLDPSARAAQLSVLLPDYRHPELQTFAYRLRGLQEDWVYQRSNVITLSGLPAGSYTLEIKGQNANGQWAENTLTVPLRMLPPLYLRWWFLGSLALLLVGGVAGLFWLRTRQLRRENEHLEREVASRTAQIQRQTEELREEDRMKTRFFANVSHELRTPLTLILGSVAQAKKAVSGGKLPSEQTLDLAGRHADSLLRQVNQLLDLSKLEAGRLQRHDRPLALRPFLARVLAHFESQAAQRSQTLTLDYGAEETLTVLLDEEKLETMLVNLLANALKFTPAEGRVELRFTSGSPLRYDLRIEAEQSGEKKPIIPQRRTARTAAAACSYLVIHVVDTGRGIHPADLPRIFERFFQTSRPDAPAEGGTGIGLSLVQELAHLLGGTVSVTSELGVGSTFELRLPLVLAEVQPTPEPTQSLTVPPSLPQSPTPSLPPSLNPSIIPSLNPSVTQSLKPRLLLVEDHPDMRDYVAGLLDEDFSVETAPDGLQALERLRRGGPLPELILSDRMMPGLDGLQLLDALRADKTLPLIPFVMLTARAAEADRLDALRVGVDDYLTKPFRAEELLARLRNLIHNARERARYARELTAQPPEPAAPPPETRTTMDWLERAETAARQGIAQAGFGVGDLAEALALSERQLFRQVKSLTGLTPNQYVQEIRLHMAREYREIHPGRGWKQVGQAVGFRDEEYLARLYRERFGVELAEV